MIKSPHIGVARGQVRSGINVLACAGSGPSLELSSLRLDRIQDESRECIDRLGLD